MPTKAKRFRIFLSSPGNLSEDRNTVKRVIDEINIDTGSRSGYFIELVTWETHTYPSAGAHPQEVINSQIPKDIDIFIGLMGHRFGTPTKNWRSGTEEEFRIAHDSYTRSKRPQIMFYFSDFVKSTRDIDSKQLALVESFRAELGELGLLYGSYHEISEFSVLVRRHLNSCIQSILSEGTTSESALEEHSFASEIQSDYPFYDTLLLADTRVAAQVHLDNATQDLDTLSEIMNKQNRRSVYLTKEMNRAIQKVESGKKTSNNVKIQEGISICISSSSIFDRGLREFIKEFRSSFESFISNLQRYYMVLTKSEVEDGKKLLNEVVNHTRPFLESISSLRDSVKTIIYAIETWPNEIEALRVRKEILRALFKDLDILFTNSTRLGEEYCDEIETKPSVA